MALLSLSTRMISVVTICLLVFLVGEVSAFVRPHSTSSSSFPGSISPASGRGSFQLPFCSSTPPKRMPVDEDETATPTKEKIATLAENVADGDDDDDQADQPQVMATGYSQAPELVTAIREATDMALEALPPIVTDEDKTTKKIDLAIVSVSSLYDGNSSPSDVVPTLLEAASSYGQGIQHLVGSYSGGFISSLSNRNYLDQLKEAESTSSTDGEEEGAKPNVRACQVIEREGVPGISVVLAVLPDVKMKTFHVLGEDLPDSDEENTNREEVESKESDEIAAENWMRAIGLDGFPHNGEDVSETTDAIFLLPSPAFQNDLPDLLAGLEAYLSTSSVPTIFGAIASTVSSLSRARLFRYDTKDSSSEKSNTMIQTLADGCVGVAFSGDIQVKTMIAQGSKPVGGVYQIVKGEESTISAVALDEAATELMQQAEASINDAADDDDDDDDEGAALTDRAKMAQAYAKARIPKPVLAEANFLMKTLSDDDQAFMRKALLVGLERTGSGSAGELTRLANGQGHGYTVHQVASAAMKDGSVTLSLGSVSVEPGQRMRFYVRESAYAQKEIESLWQGYNSKREESGFSPTGCMIFSTLDRGSKFFLGSNTKGAGAAGGFESESAMQYSPDLPCISGFYSNGIIGKLGGEGPAGLRETTAVYGSASEYVFFGSKTDRPIYVPGTKAIEAAKASDEKAYLEAEEKRIEKEAGEREQRLKSFDTDAKAPRDVDGELILRRREVHSGRAMTVSAVEWSVAEKAANPTSALEGYMWDKETEVDRFRERVPLANLVSQCRLCQVDPSKPKPRDWIGPVKKAASKGAFVIIPECKRMEPVTGSLRKRYDIPKLVKEFTGAGVPAISVNCDGVLFGGALEDLTKARDASVEATNIDRESEDEDEENFVSGPPILASDLLLYPYQLYKMRLAGADAVNLLAAPLEKKDLVYLTKIAASLQMQTFVTVSSEKQVDSLSILPSGSLDGLIVSNRDLEDFSFDMTGKQALRILKSDALKAFLEKHGDEAPVFVEGRVGIIKGSSGSATSYINDLQEAGATGAIVGGGLVPTEGNETPLRTLLQTN